MLCRFLGCLLLLFFVFSKKSAYDDEHCNLTVLFSRLIWELATDDARRKWRDDLEQMKLNEPGKSKLKRIKLLAMYETYMGIFWPTPDYKVRNIRQFRVLNSSALRGIIKCFRHWMHVVNKKKKKRKEKRRKKGSSCAISITQWQYLLRSVLFSAMALWAHLEMKRLTFI